MEILELNEDLVIGAGGHKKVYIDPRDNKRCVKILLEEKCEDWEREKKYREIRKARGQHGMMLPEYYGEIATNLGTGMYLSGLWILMGKIARTLGNFCVLLKKCPVLWK